jgi:hypothetical protein
LHTFAHATGFIVGAWENSAIFQRNLVGRDFGEQQALPNISTTPHGTAVGRREYTIVNQASWGNTPAQRLRWTQRPVTSIVIGSGSRDIGANSLFWLGHAYAFAGSFSHLPSPSRYIEWSRLLS